MNIEIGNLARKNEREFFLQKEQQLLRQMEEKLKSVDKAVETNDPALIDKSLAECKAFFTEMKFTNPGFPEEEYHDFMLKLEAKELTYKLHTPNAH